MPSSKNALRDRTGNAARVLMEWAASARTRPLPEAVRRRTGLILADDIGAMIAASEEPQVRTARTQFIATSSRGEATVFARGAMRCDRFTAAATNGMAATWCELDEGFRSAPCHAGAYALPALLAEAEVSNASTAVLLQNLAVAYEITARMAMAFPFKVMTVHPHAAFVTAAAAAASSLARNHDGKTLLGAVTGAMSMAFAGPYKHAIDGALVRNAWTSAGAWIGMKSADWAEAGITGIPETPFDVFVGAFGTDVEPDALIRNLGETWAVSDGYHKIFACCQYAHATIEASLVLNKRLGAGRNAEDIAEIVVETHPRGMTLTTVEPETVLAAKFSMPHAAAASACLGTGGQQAFSDATLRDERIANLRHRVRLMPHPAIGPWPNDRPSRVTWRFHDGEQWTASCDSARGGADQPFDEMVLMRKLGENTDGIFPRMRALLQSIIEGEGEVLSVGWRDLTAAMVSEGV